MLLIRPPDLVGERWFYRHLSICSIYLRRLLLLMQLPSKHAEWDSTKPATHSEVNMISKYMSEIWDIQTSTNPSPQNHIFDVFR